MKESVAHIYRQIEEWELEDLERLQSELECLISEAEKKTCLSCYNPVPACKCFL